MAGVPLAFTGTAMPQLNIRGIVGGGVPWTLTAAKGKLKQNGRLLIEVDGLVLATTLSNPGGVPRHRELPHRLRCHHERVDRRHLPGHDRACQRGRRRCEDRDAPGASHPCIAPIVFVTSTGGSWFASTGG